MTRIANLFLVIAIALTLGGCASLAPPAATAPAPHFDGVYQLTYSNTGSTLYYRFLPGGVVLTARSNAPAADVLSALESGNYGSIEVNSGTWSLEGDSLRVGVTESTVSYDSRFDLRPDGSIALQGMTRTFEFRPLPGADNSLDLSTR